MAKRTGRFTVLGCLFLTFGLSMRAEDLPEPPKKSPGGTDFSLSNYVCAATFLGKRVPSFYSSVFLYPYYHTPEFLGDKKVRFSGELGMNVEWLDSSNITPSNPARTPKVSDLHLKSSIPKAFNFANAGISLSPMLEVEVPVSTSSLNMNRVLGIGANVSAAWSNAGFTLTYKPSLTGYIHSEAYMSSLCAMSATNDGKRPSVMSDGRCFLDGRQTLGVLRNGVTLEYMVGKNTLTAALRTSHAFLRPTDNPSPTDKNYTLTTLGVLEYAYSLSFGFPVILTAGMLSNQPAFSKSGKLKFPFFDLESPANTEFYIRLDLFV